MSEASTPRGLAAGAILARRYRVLRKLGEGGLGAVYLAEHIQIGRRDAIKVLHDAFASDQEAIARFLRGARNLSAVRHPNVCSIYDFTETQDGLRFLAMEYVEGPTLKEVLAREGRLAADRSIAIAAQTADALQAAHEAGVVHRDLKPSNIMLASGRGGRQVVKVVDFDIAKATLAGDEVTRLGFVVGTPEYMSPEQLMGEPLDGRSDLYALALVLFRMLTGTLPFRAEGPQDLMVARLTSSPMRLEAALPGASFADGLQHALDRALQRKPADRQPDAAEFARQLRAEPSALPPGPESTAHGTGAVSTAHDIDTRSTAPSTGLLPTAPFTGTLDVPPTRISPAVHTGPLASPSSDKGEGAGGGPEVARLESGPGDPASAAPVTSGGVKGGGRRGGAGSRAPGKRRPWPYIGIGGISVAVLAGAVMVLSNGHEPRSGAQAAFPVREEPDHADARNPSGARGGAAPREVANPNVASGDTEPPSVGSPDGVVEQGGQVGATGPDDAAVNSGQERATAAGLAGVAAGEVNTAAGMADNRGGEMDRPANAAAEGGGETPVDRGRAGGRPMDIDASAEIRFRSPDALDEALLDLSLRLHDLDAPPPVPRLPAIRDTLLAALDQASAIGQRRSAVRLLALVELHRGNIDGCLAWSAEVDRLGGDAAELDALCSRARP